MFEKVADWDFGSTSLWLRVLFNHDIANYKVECSYFLFRFILFLYLVFSGEVNA